MGKPYKYNARHCTTLCGPSRGYLEAVLPNPISLIAALEQSADVEALKTKNGLSICAFHKNSAFINF